MNITGAKKWRKTVNNQDKQRDRDGFVLGDGAIPSISIAEREDGGVLARIDALILGHEETFLEGDVLAEVLQGFEAILAHVPVEFALLVMIQVR